MSAKKNQLSKLTESAPGVAKANSPSVFRRREDIATPKNVIVKSFSPILKPAAWPVIDGKPGVMVGKFEKIFQTKTFERKIGGKKEVVQGFGVEIIPEGAPVGVALPLTATLITGLGVEIQGDKATSPYVGRTVEIELIGKVPSKRGQDAWNFLVAIYPEAGK